jgi:hypothetical protein
MTEQPAEALPPWEAEWTLFGPIPNEGTPPTWPGKDGWRPLPLDGATEIPAEVTIEGRVYPAVRAESRGGVLDMEQIFHYLEGCPINYMMLEITAEQAGRLPVGFGANWGTIWWLNGEEIYDTRVGNMGDPMARNAHQFLAPLRAGKNLFVVRVCSGGPGWVVSLGLLPLREGAAATTASPVRLLPHEPVRTRDYAVTSLRVEERPGPVPAEESRMREAAMAEHGVQAHWIGIVDPTGSPYGSSQILPQRAEAEPGDEEALREQVRQIHAQGMSAVTWFGGNHSRSAAQAHPEWRVVSLVPGAPALEWDAYALCPFSPFGEALIQFTIESLGKYDLDGFWFDGTTWGWGDHVVCACEHCRRRFAEEEGLEFPAAAEWSDPAFQRWAMWRYRAFMRFWGELADRVRREHPHATIAINHLHRLRSSWATAIPVDRYDARVLVGSEAQDSPFESSFHGRLVSAYRKPESEVWMGLHKLFTRTPYWPEECQPLYRYLHHALATITAGSWPSFGTPDPGEKLTEAYDALHSLIDPRRPYAGGEPEPYAGLHLSQQGETFYFTPAVGSGYPEDYWHSLYGWDKLLAEKQVLAQIAFDAELAPEELGKYPVFLAPLSVALSAAQLRALGEYAAGGGVLVVGPGFAALDAGGNPADPARAGELLGHPAQTPQSAEALLESVGEAATVRRVGAGWVVELAGNAGLAFERRRSARLADEVAALLARLAPPRVTVEGPRRLHVGLFRQPGRLLLHVQNFMAWSEAVGFPDPAVAIPEPARGVRVTLRGMEISAARLVTAPGAPEVPLTRAGDAVTLTLPVVEWGETLELEV